MQRIHVAAGVIYGAGGEILIARRPVHLHQGGLWEFPGGKVDAGESVEQALSRELQEELGITPTRVAPLLEVHHDYPDKSVFLDVWTVSDFDGEPHGREGQQVHWVAVDQLSGYEFPEANLPILECILEVGNARSDRRHPG